MDALRVRLGSVFEWAVAAMFLGATLLVAVLIAAAIAAAHRPRASVETPLPATVATPACIPAGAVSVPVLPFSNGRELRVGDTAAAVATRLGRAAELGRQEVDRGVLGERLTRFYEYAGFRFIVVYEPFERGGEYRITGIYLP
jgi:hypothetical protein